MTTRLQVEPEDARERLGRRIELGEQLRESPPSSVQALELEIEKWNDFNAELLQHLFDSKKVADEYRGVHVNRVLLPDNHDYAHEFFLELLTRKLANLGSLVDRLPLFEGSLERSVTTSDQSRGTATPSLDIFISHSSADVALVEHLVDLLQHSLQLAPERIRATSVDSYRLPGGVNTNETLRREAIEARLFIGVISSRSLASVYVVFELGARWGSRNPFVPLVTSDLDSGAVGSPLRDITYKRCTQADLHALIREFGEQLQVTPLAPDRYQRHLERVIEADEMLEAERMTKSNNSEGPILDVRCRPLDAKQPANWSDAWRLSIEVTNLGPSGEFQVKLMRGVRGLDDDDYGNFLLQWDLVENETRPIYRDDSAILHVASSQDRTLRFLGPSTVYGPQTFYKAVKPVGDVWGSLEIRDVTSGRYRRTPLSITFDHEHRPYLELPDFGS